MAFNYEVWIKRYLEGGRLAVDDILVNADCGDETIHFGEAVIGSRVPILNKIQFIIVKEYNS